MRSSQFFDLIGLALSLHALDALWTKPWRNFFQYFEIMVSNDTMNPETLFEHGKVAQSMLKDP